MGLLGIIRVLIKCCTTNGLPISLSPQLPQPSLFSFYVCLVCLRVYARSRVYGTTCVQVGMHVGAHGSLNKVDAMNLS